MERRRATRKPTPVLRKDFLYHEYQVYEPRMAGADAILLITAVLGDNDLRRLRQLAESSGMAALVEVHDEAELERALKTEAQIIGVNNRNLKRLRWTSKPARLRALNPTGQAAGERERHPQRRRCAAHGCHGLRCHPRRRDVLQAAAGRARREGARVRQGGTVVAVSGCIGHAANVTYAYCKNIAASTTATSSAGSMLITLICLISSRLMPIPRMRIPPVARQLRQEGGPQTGRQTGWQKRSTRPGR